MKKYLLPSGLILLLGLGLAVAQQTFRAIQLSQDTTGIFQVDTNFGVYFPGHLLMSGTNRPAPTVNGTGSTPTIASTSTDNSGTVTAGTSSSVINIVFGQAFLSVPNCVVTWQSPGTVTSPLNYTVVATGINVAQGATTGDKINYWCSGPN